MTRFGSKLQTHWDWRAACNFMFGGTGSGLVLLAFLFSLPMLPPSPLILLALAFVGLGLFMVWLEIGRPWRFLHVFFHPQTSWMSREASVGTLLFPLTLLGAVMHSQVVLAIAALLGALFLYCQGRILKAAAGIPAWRDPTIVGLIVTTGLAEGGAIAGALLYSLNVESVLLVKGVLAILLILTFARAVCWLAYRAALTRAEAPPASLAVLTKLHPEYFLGGCIVPAVLYLIGLSGSMTGICLFIAAILITATGWRAKYAIIVKAAYKQGYGIGKLRKGRPKLKPPVRRAGDPVQY